MNSLDESPIVSRIDKRELFIHNQAKQISWKILFYLLMMRPGYLISISSHVHKIICLETQRHVVLSDLRGGDHSSIKRKGTKIEIDIPLRDLSC